MKFKKKKIIIGVVVVAAIGAAVYLKTNKDSSKPVGKMVTATSVVKKDIEDSITLKAPLEGTESVDVVSKLHYEVLKINVKEGDKVTKGQILAVLNSKTLQTEIAAAKDEVELLKLQLNKKLSDANESYALALSQLDQKLSVSQKDYEKAVSDFNEAERQYENLKILEQQGAESADAVKKQALVVEDMKRKVDVFNVAEGRVVADADDEKTLEGAKNGFNFSNGKAVADESDMKSIEISQKNYEKKVKDLEECEIKSVIDGTVTRVHSKVGRFADDTTSTNPLPMFVIENIENLKMSVSVSEFDIDKVKVGQKVELSADILKNETVEGVVARISPTGEEKQTTTGNIERVVPTQIDVINTNSKLIAGITAAAKIEIAKSVGTMVVPIEALVEKEEGVYQVFKVNAENKIEIIPVETGLENDLEIEIISDKIAEGDQLVLSPDLSLTEGTDVLVSGGMQSGM